ncbi:Squalene synthetase [Elusimicrobium minutum Pei191]|uniref:Squalene synthetase n=1 Tax=Elusimicrobium minutum (strain Pei191) TaxID=445932 RepID=B2KBP6_ELUMP|nr:squalene/phytoene synthase family protein [Elusimicrobium minutum]ACC97733.1 Squalene synthetase [Elusimicrobium minutum Pei191]
MNEQEQKLLNDLLKKTARTLELSAKVLPSGFRETFSIAYLVCRCADTVADTDLIDFERRLFWIERFPDIINKNKSGEIEKIIKEVSSDSLKQNERFLLQKIPFVAKIYGMLNKEDKELVFDILKKVCEGMSFDLKTFKKGGLTCLKTKEELEYYCDTMGGAPGVFWSKLILKYTPVALDKDSFINMGRNVGRALQIVNVLRDIKEDLNNGRCYFPEDELRTAGVKREDLKNKILSEELLDVLKKWIVWGRDNIGSGSAFYKAIPVKQWQIRISVAWPMLWSLDSFILLLKARNTFGNEKARISKFKIYITILLSLGYIISNNFFDFMFFRRVKKIDSLIK